MRPIFRTLTLSAALAVAALHPLHGQPGAGFRVNAGGITNVSPITVGSDPVTITITCAQGVDCGGLNVEVEAENGTKQTPGVQVTSGTFFVVVPQQMLGGNRGRLIVSGNGTSGGEIAWVRSAGPPVTVPPVTTAGAPAPGIPTVSVTKADIGALLTRDCSQLDTFTTPVYVGDTANFVVTPVGNVVVRPRDVIDENDIIAVHVIGDERVVQRLAITRTSDFRTPGQVTFLGGGLSLENILKSARDTTVSRPACVRRRYLVSDFAPGKGEIQLALVDEEGKRSEVGKFDFGVHTLYSGAFSFGPVWTQLRDPEISTATRAGKEIVTTAEDGTPRVLYVLSFTPFLWGRRELEEPGPWYTHLNPTVGIVPAHVRDNAIAGLSIDVHNSLYLQVGVHAGRVRKLDPRSGLNVGDEFTGTGDVPTVKEWDADWFAGVTVDLRAAVEFLRIAATGGG